MHFHCALPIRLFSMLLVMLITGSFAQSQPYRWQQTSGPAGARIGKHIQVGNVMCLAVWPQGADAFPSDDLHASIFRSTDTGRSWQPILTSSRFFNDFTIMDGVLYGACSKGVFASTDSGLSWNTTGAYSTTGGTYSIVHDGENLYVTGTSVEELYRSSDRGATWTRLDSAPAGWLFHDAGRIFVGDRDTIRYSTDHGESWQASEMTGIQGYAWQISLLGDSLVAIPFTGVPSYSVDQGTSWHALPGWPTYVGGSIAENDGFLYFGSRAGIFRSTDHGHRWDSLATGLPTDQCEALFLADGKLFAGVYENGLWCSDNNGDQWRDANAGLTKSYILTLKGDSTWLFAASGLRSQISRSSDAGDHWSRSTNGIPARNLITSFTAHDGVLFASMVYDTNALYRSTDRGSHWTPLPLTLRQMGADMPSHLKSLLNIGPVLLAGGYNLWRSTDLGTTWDTTRVRGWYIFGLLQQGGSTLVFSQSGLYASDDSGKTWTQRELPFSEYDGIAGEHEGDLYCSLWSRGIFRSSDQGRNWTPLPFPSPARIQYAFAFWDRYVFISNENGVFFSTDRGDTWNDLNAGFHNRSVLSLLVHDSTLYAGTQGDGVWKLRLNTSFPLDVWEAAGSAPRTYSLDQNYPNPFNPQTTIAYSVPKETEVSLTVCDLLGRTLEKLVDGKQQAGSYSVRWDAGSYPTGVYFYRLTTGLGSAVRKMILVR